MQLEKQAHNTQQEQQTVLTNKLWTAEQMLQEHQMEMVETFHRRIQGVKEEVREHQLGESNLRSELQHHVAKNEKLTSTEVAKSSLHPRLGGNASVRILLRSTDCSTYGSYDSGRRGPGS